MDPGSEKSGGVASGATLAGATRVRFRERQVLRASDLATEQLYLIAARRRHNIGHHGWGIVQGLQILATPEIVVQPGVAVDGYGRELIVPAPIVISPEAFTELNSSALDVWLFYDLVSVNLPQRGSWECGPGHNTRVREVASLRLTAAREIDPGFPVEVPFEDLPFPPYRTSPDDAGREWPVFLGTVNSTATDDEPTSGRPYASLTGEMVTAPSGRAKMQVGSEQETDTRRFAVSVADAAGKFTERLAVDREGKTAIRGNTTVLSRAGEDSSSRLRMRQNNPPVVNQPTRSSEPLCGPPPSTQTGRTSGAASMVHLLPLAATPEVAAPWQIYRTSIKEGDLTIQQLRVEIGHPGDKGDPKLSSLSVGTGQGDTYTPVLTLAADCTLTIQGNVIVNGHLIEGAIQADASDPWFVAEIANQWAAGTTVGESIATTPPAPGNIQGSVQDAQGAAIPGAIVQITSVQTTITRTVTTNDEGRFAFLNLPPGSYSVTVVGRSILANVDLPAGQTVTVTLSEGVVG